MKTPEKKENLSEGIKIIEKIHLSHSDLAETILVLLELKPATDFNVYKYDENPKNIRKKLEKAGLVVRELEIVDNEHGDMAARFAVALNEKTVDRLADLGKMMGKAKETDEEYGRLMGFPETAIEAFLNKEDLLPGKDYPPMEGVIFGLMFSKDHYQEEFQVLKNWSESIKQYAPKLYKEMRKPRRKTTRPVPGMAVGERRLRPRVYFALKGLLNKRKRK